MTELMHLLAIPLQIILWTVVVTVVVGVIRIVVSQIDVLVATWIGAKRIQAWKRAWDRNHPLRKVQSHEPTCGSETSSEGDCTCRGPLDSELDMAQTLTDRLPWSVLEVEHGVRAEYQRGVGHGMAFYRESRPEPQVEDDQWDED